MGSLDFKKNDLRANSFLPPLMGGSQRGGESIVGTLSPTLSHKGRGGKFPQGVGIIAILLIVSVLSLMGGVITMLVATGSVAKTNDLVKEQSFALVNAGLEYAFERIDGGANPNGETRNLGNGSFTISYTPGSTVTVNTSVSAMQGTANSSFSVTAPSGGGGAAACLVVDTAAASIGGGGNKDLLGITLRNNCQGVSITIASMTVAWTPLTSATVRTIRINGSNVYNSPSGTASGVPINITDVTIPTCTTQNLDFIRFSANMSGKTFTITFTMSDATTKVVTTGPF